MVGGPRPQQATAVMLSSHPHVHRFQVQENLPEGYRNPHALAFPLPLVSDLQMGLHLIQSCSDAPHATHNSIMQTHILMALSTPQFTSHPVGHHTINHYNVSPDLNTDAVFPPLLHYRASHPRKK